MKMLRFVVAVAALLLVWLVVFVGVGLLIGILFPHSTGAQFLVFWLDWHGLPGLLLGLFMGVRAYRAVLRGRKPAHLPTAPPTPP